MSLFRKLFGKAPSPRTAVPSAVSSEFERELEISRHYLRAFTELNANDWGLGKHERYTLSQKTGVLRFEFANGRTVEAPYQAIGSLNPSVGTWKWAWAAAGLDERFTVDARRVRMYGERNGVDALTVPEYPADLPQAWDMVAFATRACEAKGALAMPFGPLRLFMSFGEVRLIEPSA